MFDNSTVKIFFLLLPFSYALTFNVGFPLKISEIALFILVLLLILKFKFTFPILETRIFSVLSIFILITLISTSINIFWEYPYQLQEYESRFGYKFDSILKFFYLLLAFFTFIICNNIFYLNEEKYVKYFLLGAFIASLYSWYLFLSGLLSLTPLLLPGMEEPQQLGTSMGIFIRSGTFKEGNYMGLFLVFSIILSFYLKKTRLAYFFIATLLTTFSSIALACTVLFLIGYYFKNFYNKKHLLRLIGVFIVLIVSFFLLLQTEDFKLLVVSKFTRGSGDISNVGEYSKVDRMNSALVGFKIGLENPILGVGLSNYSLHYKQFNEDIRFENIESKRIANNIYVEIFAETGVFGFLLFLYLLVHLFQQTKYDETGALRFGILVCLVYFFAFPTFTTLYIWAFFGLVSSLHARKNESYLH